MALGIVLAPYGQLPDGNYPYNITMSRGGDNSHYLGPLDPQYYNRGEAGYYYDSHLGDSLPLMTRWKLKRQLKKMRKAMGMGAIPTDAEMASNRGYTPVESAWIATTNQGLIPGPWNPPNGWLQMGAFGPRSAPRTPTGLGDSSIVSSTALVPTDTPVPAQPASAMDVMAALQAHNDRIFALTLVSTTAVAISALITVFRTLRLLRKE